MCRYEKIDFERTGNTFNQFQVGRHKERNKSSETWVQLLRNLYRNLAPDREICMKGSQLEESWTEGVSKSEESIQKYFEWLASKE